MATKADWAPVLEGLSGGPAQAGGVQLAVCAPGEHPGAHLQLLFAPERAVLGLRDGRRVPLCAGSVLLLRSRAGCRVESGRTLAVRYPESFFDGLFFSQLADCRILYDLMRLPDPEEEFLCFDYRPDEPVWECLLALCRELLLGDGFTGKLLHCGTVQLFTLLQRGFRDHLAVSRSTMLRQNAFGQMLKYMGDHYDTVTLEELARRFNYNPSYLSAYFRRVTGETFSHKLYHIRMEQALWALEHTDRPVQDISQSLGFKEKSYFLRRFKAEYGCTPTQYRKRLGLPPRGVCAPDQTTPIE